MERLPLYDPVTAAQGDFGVCCLCLFPLVPDSRHHSHPVAHADAGIRAQCAGSGLLAGGYFLGIGLAIEGFQAQGWSEVSAFRMAMAFYLPCTMVSCAYFLMTKSHNQPPC